MNEVKVKKVELLEILKKNRADHRDIFLKAQEGYRKAAIEELDRQLNDARNGKPFLLTRFTALVQPKDYTGEYDRAILMLQMSVDDIVTIEKEQFANFVQDKWQWSRAWAASNSSYTSSPKFADYEQ